MDKLKTIVKYILIVLAFPIVILLYLTGKEAILKLLIGGNNKKQDELKEQEELVDKAINDLNQGINKIKTSPSDNPSDVENYHKKYNDEKKD